ncbi:MAG: hypothetical protein U5K54_20940 [Cytophagales bacterium]|nr:hypothetical protein [Cytophagales bacterium]
MILSRNGKYLRGLKLKQVEQRIMEYLHNEEPKNWEETAAEVESLESLEAKTE